MPLTPQTIEASLHRHVDTQLTSLRGLVVPHMTMPGYPVHDQMSIIMQTVDALTDNVVPPSLVACARIASAMKMTASSEATLNDVLIAIDSFDANVRKLLATARHLSHNPF